LVRKLKRYGPWGNYSSWSAALANSGPYRTNLHQMETLLAEVEAGKLEPADFDGIHLAAVLSLDAPVKVLDFGGGVGLGYTRAMRSIPDLIAWWRIVDLPDVVNWGKAKRADKRLSFRETIKDALGDDRPTLIMCGGVLQCVPMPYLVLADLFALKPEAIVLGRVPIEDRERFAVFHTVSGDVIPWRALDKSKIAELAGDYQLTYEQKLARGPGDAAADEFNLLYFSPLRTPTLSKVSTAGFVSPLP
jgi:putative methyltransferase (TIGR04325 family)